MAIFPAPVSKSPSWPITVGAEGIAAAQFARCGFDVLVQSGRDKPWYDLVVTKGGNLLKVSVKASENGEWPLTSGFTCCVAETSGMRIDCRSMIDMWRAGYGTRTVCCLVQFEGVAIHQMPRIYLASPDEIAAVMREISERTGRCTLLENYEWPAEDATRRFETLPQKWHFSQARVHEMLAGQGTGASIAPLPARSTPASASNPAPAPVAACNVSDPVGELAFSV